MGFLSMLNKTCTIQEPTETQDGTGAITQVWSDVATNVATRFHRVSRERIIDGNYHVTLEDFVFYFAVTTTIRLGDRIVVDSTAYEVLSVVEHSKTNHQTVYAKVIKFG